VRRSFVTVVRCKSKGQYTLPVFTGRVDRGPVVRGACYFGYPCSRSHYPSWRPCSRVLWTWPVFTGRVYGCTSSRDGPCSRVVWSDEPGSVYTGCVGSVVPVFDGPCCHSVFLPSRPVTTGALFTLPVFMGGVDRPCSPVNTARQDGP